MKNEFIELALQVNALRFGDFTLKSGRKSPYFFNIGMFYHGDSLQKLGKFYAQVILDSNITFDNLFGPAYKGLPIATATAISLSQMGINKTVTFNRKEEKDHGEGGVLIGAPLTGDTIILDDVITAGTAFREAKALINANGARVKAVVIALDRCEKGATNSSTLDEIRNQGIEVKSIINFFDLLDYIKTIGREDILVTLENYHAAYGCAYFS